MATYKIGMVTAHDQLRGAAQQNRYPEQRITDILQRDHSGLAEVMGVQSVNNESE